MNDRKEFKQLVILRGAQGSGKTSTAAVWANWEDARWYEADQYWEDRNGNYDYDSDRIAKAHAWCFDMVESAVRKGISRVIVSNTFRRAKDVDRYADLGHKWGYDVKVYVVAGKHDNTHGVPDDVVAKCRAEMEPYVGEFLYCSGTQDIRALMDLYPKYRDVGIVLPDKIGFFGGFPMVSSIHKEEK